MAFHVHYVIDEVGYVETIAAANAEDAKADCEGRIKAAYPASACEVVKVEKAEKVKKVKEKDDKDDKEDS